MTLSSCQVVPHLSPRWDTGGLCSASPINRTLIKAFCLVKRAAWETLWKGSYHLEAATEKKERGGGGGAVAPWIPQSLNGQSWNHSENRTHLDEFHLKIDSLECNLTDKKLLFGKTRWATHKLAYVHRATMETIPVSQWEYVSAYSSLSLQSSTLLGFVVRGTLPRGQASHANRRHLCPEATISWNSCRNRGAPDRGEIMRSSFVPWSHFCPFVQFPLCSRNGAKMDASISASTIFNK